MEAPQIPASDSLRFRARLATRWSDEDNQEVLNNAVFLTLLEESRLAYFRSLGLLEGGRFPFVLAQTNIRFLRPGRGAAQVEVEMGTVRLGTRSFLQAYRVRDVESGEVWAEAEALGVAWDNQARCSRPMAAEFRRKVAEFEGLSSALDGADD